MFSSERLARGTRAHSRDYHQFNHRYYTNNMGLEAPFCTLIPLVATEVINLAAASFKS